MALTGKDGELIRKAIESFGRGIKKDVAITSPFNKTKNGRIVAVTPTGYTVEIEAREYPRVQAINTNQLYENDIVACCIPNNQMSQMYIVGKLVGRVDVSGGSGNVIDVRINGASIVSQGIANISVDTTVTSGSSNLVTSGAVYTAINNLPTVNDATLTIQTNGADLATFSANQSTNVTANITIPTKTSDLPNDGPPNGNSVYATESFVNSSIATNTANFIGTFQDVTSLESYSGTVTNNDYAFVVNSVVQYNGGDFPDLTTLNAYDKTMLTNFDYAWVINGTKFDLYRFDILDQTWDSRATSIDKDANLLNTAYNRYKATVASNVVTWDYEYTLNNSSFTAAQWEAINSGITANGWTMGTGTLDTTAGTLKLKAVQALTSSSSSATTYGTGSSGQVLKSNGTNLYWASDTNTTNAYYLQAYYFSPNAGAEAIYRYKLIALDKDNRAVPITITNQGDATTMVEKTPTSVAFKPWKIFQYNSTTTVSAGGALASHTLQEGYNANPIYNFNTTISARRVVYLCGTYDRTTGLFTLDTTVTGTNQYRNYYVQVPTNTANITLSTYFTSGKDYILVGGNYGSNANNLQLFVCNPMYHFDGTNLVPYDTYNENRVESSIPTVNNGTLTIQLNGGGVQTFTANQSANATANIQALPNFSLNISHQTAGNPRQVKFLTIDYNTKATYFKMSATSCHDNGSSYQFLEDIIIGCTTGGVVVCNVYKYCQASVTLDGVSRNYGDVFYVIDTTNKRVDFYILCGQYASSQFTPATKIGNTTIQYITQYTGTATYYSSGTKVWAHGNSTTYALLSDITAATGDEAATSSTLSKRDSSANLNATSFSMCTSGTSTVNAKMQYNSSNESIEFIFS